MVIQRNIQEMFEINFIITLIVIMMNVIAIPNKECMEQRKRSFILVFTVLTLKKLMALFHYILHNKKIKCFVNSSLGE